MWGSHDGFGRVRIPLHPLVRNAIVRLLLTENEEDIMLLHLDLDLAVSSIIFFFGFLCHGNMAMSEHTRDIVSYRQSTSRQRSHIVCTRYVGTKYPVRTTDMMSSQCIGDLLQV